MRDIKTVRFVIYLASEVVLAGITELQQFNTTVHRKLYMTCTYAIIVFMLKTETLQCSSLTNYYVRCCLITKC